eukprot:UN02529
MKLQAKLNEQQQKHDKLLAELKNKNKYYHQQIVSLINLQLGEIPSDGKVIEQYYSDAADEFVVVDDDDDDVPTTTTTTTQQQKQ